MSKSRFKSLIAFIVLWSITASSMILAQENTVYLLRNGQLVQLGSRVDTLSSSAPDISEAFIITDVLSADLTTDSQFIFEIVSYQTDSRGLPSATRLIRLDTVTGETTTILDRPGIFAFSLSPQQGRVAVGYFESDPLIDNDYGSSRQRLCIFDLSDLPVDCSPQDFQISWNIGAWISEDEYVVLSTRSGFHFFELASNEERLLSTPPEFVVYAPIAAVPNSRWIVVGGFRQESYVTAVYPALFFTINVDTNEFRQLTFGALNVQDYPVVSSYDFSPDGQYLLYGGTRRALVEFATGRLIDEFPFVASWGWVGDNTLMLQGSIDEGDPLEIARIEPTTGQVIQLLSGTAAEGILLVP